MRPPLKSTDELSLGIQIAKLRYKKGFLQNDLAEIINIPLKDLAQIELGRYDLNLDILDKIAHAIGCKLALIEIPEKK